ncbi:MAG: hypothetical protein AAB853_03535 [Patescibacteria group bacterium]
MPSSAAVLPRYILRCARDTRDDTAAHIEASNASFANGRSSASSQRKRPKRRSAPTNPPPAVRSKKVSGTLEKRFLTPFSDPVTCRNDAAAPHPEREELLPFELRVLALENRSKEGVGVDMGKHQ